MTDETYYVVGDWKNEDKQCPLSKADLEGSEWAEPLAEDFDSCARMEYDLPEGISYINEDKAQEVWNQMIERFHHSMRENAYEDVCHSNQMMLELAEEVQEELSWI